MEKQKEKDIELKKKTFTFFLLFFPSLILSIIPYSINGSFITAIGLKICVLLLQLVAVKNFVDTYYD